MTCGDIYSNGLGVKGHPETPSFQMRYGVLRRPHHPAPPSDLRPLRDLRSGLRDEITEADRARTGLGPGRH